MANEQFGSDVRVIVDNVKMSDLVECEEISYLKPHIESRRIFLEGTVSESLKVVLLTIFLGASVAVNPHFRFSATLTAVGAMSMPRVSKFNVDAMYLTSSPYTGLGVKLCAKSSMESPTRPHPGTNVNLLRGRCTASDPISSAKGG
jgi:hypothetical protein